MRNYAFALLAVFALSACSKDSKKSEPVAPPTPDRKAEHRQDQCPAGIVGKYADSQDATNVFEIVIQGGYLVVKDPESGDVVVNGESNFDADNESNITVICKNGKIELRSSNKDGSTSESTITKTATGLKAEFTEKNETYTVEFDRKGDPDSPTETDLVLSTGPTQNTTEAVNCNGGFEVSYRYKETVNNVSCDTGERVFCTLASYCAGLKDEALNNSCGKTKRERDYAAMCAR